MSKLKSHPHVTIGELISTNGGTTKYSTISDVSTSMITYNLDELFLQIKEDYVKTHSKFFKSNFIVEDQLILENIIEYV